MQNMKFYIWLSNIAISFFGILFLGIGFFRQIVILIVLGAALIIYGILRLRSMLKAFRQNDIRN